MADVARLVVAVSAQTREMEAAFARSTRKVQAFADGVGSVGSALFTRLTVPALAAGAAIGVATAKMDSLKRGLEAVAGSSAGANRQLARLTEIAKAPGIGFAEAIQGSVRLQSVGFSARLAERSLKAFANAIALTGGGRDELQRVTVQLSEIANKGKILTQDIRPLINAAPVVGKALREAFGTVNAEELEKLGLTSQQFIDRLLAQLEKLPQVTGGLANAWENLKDTIFRSLATVGEDQTSALTSGLNALSNRVESLGKSFAALAPWQQKSILLLGAAAAAAGPLLIALAALANAYRTLLAINLVTGITASTRALWAQVVATRAAAGSMAAAGVAARGLWLALAGPVGLVVAIGAVGAAWVHMKNKASEGARETEAAAQRMTEALLGVSDAVAKGMLTQKNLSTAALLRGMQGLREEIDKTKRDLGALGVDASALNAPDAGPLRNRLRQFGRDVAMNFADPAVVALVDNLKRQEQTLAETERILQTRIAEMKVLAADVDARIRSNVAPPLGGDESGGEDGDRFKALKKQVEALSEGVRLRLDDSRLVGEALALERALAEQAGNVNRSLQERVTLLGLSNTLAEAARGRLETREVSVTLAGPQDAGVVGRGLEVINRAGATARARLAAIAKEAQRVERSIARWGELTRFADSLSRALGNFGGFGRMLGDTVARIGDITDAMGALRESQRSTGQGGIFANLGNLSSALGVAGAAVGMLSQVFGGLFGQSASERERIARAKENTEALNRLSTKLNALAGTADETRRAAIAAGRLEENRAEILARGILGGQMTFVNNLLRDLGLTFADLNRIAEDLGIDLIRDNGKIATDALDDLATALGYHAEIITRLADDVDTFRRVQDAAARIYNLEDTPQRALQEALDELTKFAPALASSLIAGADTSGAAGRSALQTAIQQLFERIRAGDIGLSELGTFTDVNKLLDSLLRADDALDRFTESLTESSLNVPQGFKAMLTRFGAIVGEPAAPTSHVPGVTSVQATGGDGASLPTLSISPGGLTFVIQSSDPGAAWEAVKEGIRTDAATYPALRPLAAMLPPN